MRTKLLQVAIFVNYQSVSKIDSKDQSNICKCKLHIAERENMHHRPGVGASVTVMLFKHQFINNLQKRFFFIAKPVSWCRDRSLPRVIPKISLKQPSIQTRHHMAGTQWSLSLPTSYLSLLVQTVYMCVKHVALFFFYLTSQCSQPGPVTVWETAAKAKANKKDSR